ncbi:MAG: hypothetical protein EA350_12190 [Gemmatimonadales bacterium]|nr:MAG: hypothetical protein EA350_12190 [Gemmatimonadales bacterium]
MRRTLGLTTALTAAVLWAGTAPAFAQSGPYDQYLNHDQLTRAIQDLAGRHGNLASVRSFARTDEGRDVWLLTLGNARTGQLDQKPALLIVANLEANHLVGSSTALFTAQHLLEGYGSDEEVTRLLDERTVYILPRMNPDGAELYWGMSAYEIPYKAHASAPNLGGLNPREIGADLNNDGVVTMMRQRHPEGEWVADDDDPRLLRRANRSRAERGEYRVFLEGIDTTMVDAYVPLGSDGVNLNRNFPHEYLYFQPHVGPHQVSERETRALADFMFEQTNIAAVLTFSPYDNLRSPTPETRRPPEGVAPGPPSQPSNVQGGDRPYFQYISEQFVDLTGLRGDGAPGEAGSFAQFAYYQVGLPSFTTPVWVLPEEASGARAAPAEQAGPAAGGSVVGDWAISLSMDGQALDANMGISRANSGLRVMLNSPAGATELTGQGQGDQFQASGEVQGMGEISVSGRVSGNELSGTVALGPMGTVPFSGTRVGGGEAAAAPAPAAQGAQARNGTTPEHRWLRYFENAGIDGFVDWTPATHPQLGDVEVGGFRPNVRVNPPASDIRELAGKHAAFATWLGNQTGEVEIVETRVEARGDGVWQVTATLANDRYLPTQTQMGARIRFNRPVTVRLMPTSGMTVLTGNIQQQTPRIDGMGARSSFTWLVQAPAGTQVPMEVFAERAGGLQSTTITLR